MLRQFKPCWTSGVRLALRRTINGMKWPSSHFALLPWLWAALDQFQLEVIRTLDVPDLYSCPILQLTLLQPKTRVLVTIKTKLVIRYC